MRPKPDGRRWHFLLATALVLPATFPLLQAGYFDSDDGWIHLYRLAALDRALHNGVPFPRWFPDFAFGYGYPVLNFYSPLSYYLAEAWHIAGADYLVAMKLTFAAGFLLAAWAMYLFAADAMSPVAGTIAAVAYTYAPYHLADAYLRGALAEHLAFGWFPLILWSLRRWIATRQRAYVTWLALGGAGLVLTHNLSALIFAPVAAAYAILLLGQSLSRRPSPEWRPLLTGLIVASLLALALSAFYWLPALAESRYVHLALDFGSTGYRKHLAPLTGVISPFPVHRYLPEQRVAADHPLGLVQALLAFGGVAVAVATLRRNGDRWHPAAALPLFALFVGGGALLMTSSAALPLWMLTQRVLSVLQYPWRFMALVALGTALLTGEIAALLPDGARTLPTAEIALSLVAAGALGYAGMARLPYDAESLSASQVTVQRMWKEDFAHQQIGATWTAEYLPRWVRQERWAIPRPAAEPPAATPGRITAASLRATGYGVELEITASETQPVSLHQFYFPGWRAALDGKPTDTYPRGLLGLVTADVPAGTHRLAFRFGSTPPRATGTALSLLAGIGLVAAAGWRTGWRRRMLLIAVVCVLAGATALHLRPWSHHSDIQPLNAIVGGQAQLLGFRTDRDAYRAGDSAEVTLYWLGLSSMDRDYKVFVHLTGQNDPIPLAQHDGDPVGTFTATTRWLTGELIADPHTIKLPRKLAPGAYRLWAGMYDYATGNRQAVLGSTTHESNRVLLGEIVVGGTD